MTETTDDLDFNDYEERDLTPDEKLANLMGRVREAQDEVGWASQDGSQFQDQVARTIIEYGGAIRDLIGLVRPLLPAESLNVPIPDRDQHFTNPPGEGLHLDADQLASLKVLLDHAVPREATGPMAWEGTGRRYHESILGCRAPCTCPEPRLDTNPPAAGCPVHDPSGTAPVLPSGGQG